MTLQLNIKSVLRRLLGDSQASIPKNNLKQSSKIEPTFDTKETTILSSVSHFWFEATSLTDVGTVRSNNEDAVRLLPDMGQGIRLAVLADGMGGHACGEVASDLAISSVMSYMRTQDELKLSAPKWAERLAQSVTMANQFIWQHAQKKPESTGMGTTICVLSIAHGAAYWAWVGDSRIYLWRGGKLTQLTRDDTVVNRMYEDGILSLEQAAKHPDAHVLAQALGTHESVTRINLCDQPLKLKLRDRLIMTSDGVHDVLTMEQWERCLTLPTSQAATSALIEAGKDAGSADNLSAVVVDVCPARDVHLTPAATRH